MGGMQTVLALLAVTLFSSMTLNSYNNLLQQNDVLEVSYLNLQAQEIVDRYFQKIECEMLAGKTATDVKKNISAIVPANITIGNDTFTFALRRAALCSKNCDTTHPDNHIVLVQLVLTSNYGGRTVTAGTMTNPESAIFSESAN